MHHPALSVHSAQNAHRQAGVAHSTHTPAVHKEARCRTGLEQPCRAGVKIHADEVQRGTALILTFQGKGHVDQPCRQLCGKARLEQPGRQLGGKVAIHGCRPAGAQASAASSCAEKRVRGSVTAAWVRPRSSSVTAHSCGGVPSCAKKSATRPDL